MLRGCWQGAAGSVGLRGEAPGPGLRGDSGGSRGPAYSLRGPSVLWGCPQVHLHICTGAGGGRPRGGRAGGGW